MTRLSSHNSNLVEAFIMSSHVKELSPLQDLLDSVLNRLAALESQAGIAPPAAPPASKHFPIPVSPSLAAKDDDAPAAIAYDAYMESAVVPFCNACNDLGGMENTGDLLKDAWLGVKTIVVLASRSKMPSGDLPAELQTHLKPVQTALESLRKLRLDRKFDFHTKAILELCGALSWVLIKPPPQLPSVFCKEMVSSCEFWSNKIRKDFKGKDDKQIAFCDALKKVGADLVAYITEHHKTGLTWNPHGISLTEAAVMLESKSESSEPEEPMSPRRRKQGVVTGGAGGMSSLVAELQKKQTSDGTSAATGLKRVSSCSRKDLSYRRIYVCICSHSFFCLLAYDLVETRR
jgi:adenylyl cyclase-associated protein